MGEHPGVQLTHRPRRCDTELVAQGASQGVVHLERLGLAMRPVGGPHRERGGTLVERVAGDEGLGKGQRLEGLRLAGRKVRRPDLTLAVPDHNLPTTPRIDAAGQRVPIADPASAAQLEALTANVADFGVPYIANPDLVERWRGEHPLNEPDQSTFYGSGPRGYTDYPRLSA